jgi:hypothetical protein
MSHERAHIAWSRREVNFRKETLCGEWASLHLIRLDPSQPCGREIYGQATFCPECEQLQKREIEIAEVKQ